MSSIDPGETGRFFQRSPEMLCIAGVDGRFKRVNPAFVATLGYTEAELLDRPFVEFVHPDDVEATLLEVARQVEGQRTLRFVNRYRCADGSWKALEWTIGSDPESGLLYAAAQEVTTSERARRLSEARATSIVETVIDGIITIDERGQVESFNLAAERIFGYQANEVIGCNVNILVPEPHHRRHDGYLRNFLETGEAKIIGGHGVEVHGLRKDGSQFPLHLAISETMVGGERLFTGIVRDITARRAAERTLAEKTLALENSSKFDRCEAKVMAVFNRRGALSDLLAETLVVLAEQLLFLPSSVHLFDEWSEELSLAASHALPDGFHKNFRLGEGLVGQVAASHKTFVVSSGDGAPELVVDTGIGSVAVQRVIVVPIVIRETMLGVITVGAPAVDSGQQFFLERLAAQIGIAVQNVQQYQQMQDLTNQLNERGRKIALQNAELERANRLKSEFLANM